MNCEKAISVVFGGIATLSPNSVSILLVDADSTCLTILSKMLRKFGYKVLTAKRASVALSITSEREDELDLVLAEAHLPDMDKYELLEIMGEMSKLPIVIMSANDDENDMLGGLFKGAAFYLVKPITMNDIKNLWQFAFMKKADTMVAAGGLSSIPSDEDTENQILPIRGRWSRWNAKRKDPKRLEKYEEEDNDDSSILKKPKLIWTNALHDRFLQAIRVIGIDGAHPKKILRHMNVAGLKKENISSHLQKYRLSLKREQDAIEKIMNRDYAESHLASCNLSSKVNLQGVSSQYPEMQSITISCQPKFGSQEQKNVSNCMSTSLGSAYFPNRVRPTCNDSSDYKYGQLTLSSNHLGFTYPSSSHAGIRSSSNGTLAGFREEFLALSSCPDSGFKSAIQWSTSLTQEDQEKQQQQQQLFLSQPSAQDREEHDMFVAERMEPTHLFLDKDFDDIW